MLLQSYEITGPFETVLALRNTGDSVLGHVAEGWAEPDHLMTRPSRCLDDNVLIRLEYDQLPPAEEMAMLLGERIDNAWGSTGKRFLNRAGDHIGEFDLRGIPG